MAISHSRVTKVNPNGLFRRAAAPRNFCTRAIRRAVAGRNSTIYGEGTVTRRRGSAARCRASGDAFEAKGSRSCSLR
jgi:hypothetical protein